MCTEIRLMIDKIKKLKINESIDSNLKSDLDLIFKNHPELENIGTKEQYSEYIKSIFPNSMVKDILYHASPNKFTKFNKPSSFPHIWFSLKPKTHTYGSNLYIVKVNIKNLLNQKIETRTDFEFKMKNYTDPINPEWRDNYHITGELPKYEYDGSLRTSGDCDASGCITVRDPDQIHILGSDEDIKGFEKFVKRN